MSAKDRTCAKCPAKIYRDNKSGVCLACRYTDAARSAEAAPSEQVTADRERVKSAGVLNSLKSRYAEALQTIELRDQEIEALVGLQQTEPVEIVPRYGSGTSEATVVAVASDWHGEERVDPARINGLNEFNLELADERIRRFYQSTLRLTRLLQQDVKIETLVLAKLGDFISGDIHEEVAEMCQLPPMEAAVFVQERMIGGIELLLNDSKLNLVIPCHVGNHGRTTKTSRFSAENGHSIEYLMFLHLAAYFRSEPRVQFQIATGMHSYLPIYDTTIRFHHGHAVKYGGGVGGITIPVLKAIAMWNRGRHADLDVFGHFHQLVDGGNFLCNGSLIGYNAFALSIKAAWEPPKQALFLLDKRRGKTCVWPILLKK